MAAEGASRLRVAAADALLMGAVAESSRAAEVLLMGAVVVSFLPPSQWW